MTKKEFFVNYDISSKTQYVIEDEEVVRKIQFKVCPYVWFGELRERIESGLIKWVIWKKIRFIGSL